ncbi:hypothetical protein [Gaetbulibacter aestuarii]|uniref:Glycosyl transferase family 1 domain-containing protein n=1 Tax=Gaetbulibacter aestuarii TaxID=1502358 RepID=A0ABW7N1F8_9FLAO
MTILKYFDSKIPRNAFLEYLKVKLKSKIANNKKTDKALIINVTSPEIYHRYLYGLLKFFSLEGYTIYFPSFNFDYFKKKVHSRFKPAWNYHQLIYHEGLISFDAVPEKTKNIFELNDANLSPDYFTPYFKNCFSEKNSFHIPIGMHPKFYSENHWDQKVKESTDIKKSIFMVGNFRKDFYSDFSSKPFQSIGRIEVFQHLKNENMIKEINSLSKFYDFLDGREDMACVILNSKKNHIEIGELRKVISRFYFYLALPGAVMPFSHNIIEALSVGSILIIHKEYAKMMSPELEHLKNAIIYDDLPDLTNKINLAYGLREEELLNLRRNAKEYYDLHLTPKAVVNKIINGNYDIMYLLAEHHSVEILEKNLDKAD